MSSVEHDPAVDVSRETLVRLQAFATVLATWNKSINLVSKASLANVWSRHIQDSLQLEQLAPDCERWIDLGAGGGFPGLVIAAVRAETFPEMRMTLVESDQRKCAFMAAAADRMDIKVSIECRRIEESVGGSYDVISARALAPLHHLLELALPYRHDKTVCIFPKGAKADEEVREAQKDWRFDCDVVQSSTENSASILRIREFSRV